MERGRIRWQRLEKRSGDGCAESEDCGASGTAGEEDRRAQGCEGVQDAGWGRGTGYGAEHGGMGEVPRNGAGRNDDRAAARGGAGQGGEFLYGEFADSEGDDPVYDARRRNGSV